MSFFRSLFHSNAPDVDSLIFGGVCAILGLVACSGWATWTNPHDFNPLTYGAGAASILGGLGGARRLRDGLGDTTTMQTPTTATSATPTS